MLLDARRGPCGPVCNRHNAYISTNTYVLTRNATRLLDAADRRARATLPASRRVRGAQPSGSRERFPQSI